MVMDNSPQQERPETVEHYEDGYSWSNERRVYVRNDLPGDHHQVGLENKNNG